MQEALTWLLDLILNTSSPRGTVVVFLVWLALVAYGLAMTAISACAELVSHGPGRGQ